MPHRRPVVTLRPTEAAADSFAIVSPSDAPTATPEAADALSPCVVTLDVRLAVTVRLAAERERRPGPDRGLSGCRKGSRQLTAPAVAVPPAAPASAVVVAVWLPVAESESVFTPAIVAVFATWASSPALGDVEGDRRADADALARNLLGQGRRGAAGRGLRAQRQACAVEIDVRARGTSGAGRRAGDVDRQ